jgi:sRNA-binding carbon storage regulator CsrA
MLRIRLHPRKRDDDKTDTPQPDAIIIDAFDDDGRPVEIIVTLEQKENAAIGITAPKSIPVNRLAIKARKNNTTPKAFLAVRDLNQ